MIRKQVQFTERQTARIRREAARRGVSESAVIREALDRGLGGATRPTREQWDAALGAAGIGRSGLGDLAAEHDRYYADDLEGERRDERTRSERSR